MINIFLGVLYYLIIRTPLCPYNGCVSLPTQHTWRDTIERFLETFFVFWKEKYSYIYTPKIDPILLSTGYVRHAFRAQNLFLSDQWYYNTSRAIITECLSMALNYYISFAIIIFIINKLFVNVTPYSPFEKMPFSTSSKIKHIDLISSNELQLNNSDQDQTFNDAAVFYPLIKQHFSILMELNIELAEKYKNDVLVSKSFSTSIDIYEDLLAEYISKNIHNSDGIIYAKSLISNNDFNKLKELIKISKLLGKSFDLKLFLNKIN